MGDNIKGQMSIFDLMSSSPHEYVIDKPIRLIETFAGIGAQAKALERIGADFEHWKISEWEVSAVSSYYKIHMRDDETDYSADIDVNELQDRLFNMQISTDGKKPMSRTKIKAKGEKWIRRTYNRFMATHNLGSITTIYADDLQIVDKDKYIYLFTYSFPCTDLSVAGKQKGMTKDSGTGSSLIWEVERILTECKEKDCLPQILQMENVPQVHGKKFIAEFNEFISRLERLGYSNYWQDLNAKNYGVAQQRNRTFMISLLGNYSYEFPEPIPLDKCMKDYLDDEVDEKYYVNNERAQKLIQQLIDSGKLEKSGGAERENSIDDK